ncbi:MAG: TolC family protein [Chitinophagales bacterium]
MIRIFQRMLNTCLTILIITLYSSNPGIAQSKLTITLDEAIKMGIEASNQMKIARGKYDYARSKHSETYDLQYPSAKLSAGYSRLSPVPEFRVLFPGASEPQTLFPVYLNSFQNRLSLNEVIFAGFRVKNAKESADKALGASLYDLEQDQDDVKLNIITACFNLYKIQQANIILDENMKLIELRLQDVQNLARNGMATHNDELRAELQQSNTELSKIEAVNIYQEANFSFNLLLGLPGDVEIILDTTSLFTAAASIPKDSFLRSALQNRPEVLALRLRNEATNDNLKIAQNGALPTISAGANLYFASPNQRYIPPTDVFHTTWDVGVTLSWDITTAFTNKHIVAENKALLDQSNAQLLQLDDGIKTEVYQSYLGYTESLEKIKVLEKAVRLAQENLMVTDSRYRNNVALLSELTDAQTQQLQSTINLVIAKADARISYYRLLQSAGDF